ncbi:MAG: hypothetical protein JXR76_12625 [Deltaproteobacteria bacterium]|nr:hypothetical protein [Deltaproteobacteria bacterium]
MTEKMPLTKHISGTAQVEEIVLLATVALVFAAATLVLGPALLNYHAGIETVLALPIP